MNGIVVSYMHHDKRGGILIEVFTETDFAARTQAVYDFGYKVAMLIYGFQVDSWDELLKMPCNVVVDKELEQLRAELKEDVKVGRCKVLKLGVPDALLETPCESIQEC